VPRGGVSVEGGDAKQWSVRIVFYTLNSCKATRISHLDQLTIVVPWTDTPETREVSFQRTRHFPDGATHTPKPFSLGEHATKIARARHRQPSRMNECGQNCKTELPGFVYMAGLIFATLVRFSYLLLMMDLMRRRHLIIRSVFKMPRMQYDSMNRRSSWARVRCLPLRLLFAALLDRMSCQRCTLIRFE